MLVQCIFSVVYYHWAAQRAWMLTPAAVDLKEEQPSPCLDSPSPCKLSGCSMKEWTKFSEAGQIPWGSKNVFIWGGQKLCHLPLAFSHVWWAKRGGPLGWKAKTVWSAGRIGMSNSLNGTLLLAHERVQCNTMGYCAAEEVVLRVRHCTHKTQRRSWPLCGH